MTDRPNSLLSALGRNTGWVFAANAISSSINMGMLIWFARVLGGEAMGAYAQIVVTIDVIVGLVSFGLNQSLIRTPNYTELRAAVVGATIAQTALIVLIMSLVLMLDTGDAADSLTVGVLTVSARCVSLFTFIVDADYRGRLQYRPIAFCQAVAAVGGTLMGLWALWAGAGIVSIAVKELSTSLIVFCYFALRYEHPWQLRSSRRAYASMWEFTRSLWILNVLERLALRLDYLLVGYVLGRESLGIYFAVRGLVEGALGFVLNPIQTVLYSFYCRFSDVRALIAKLNKYAATFIAFAIGGAVLAYLLPATSLVYEVLGEDYVAGAVMLPGLLMYAIAIVWFENTKVVAMSSAVHGRIVLARLCQVCILALIMLPLTDRWGLIGATIATGIGAMGLATAASFTLARVLGVRTADVTRT